MAITVVKDVQTIARKEDVTSLMEPAWGVHRDGLGSIATTVSNWFSYTIDSRLLTEKFTIFDKQRAKIDIMVWSAVKNVLDIVRTTRLVITSMVHVTKDVMMDGLEKSVTKVYKFCIK